MLRQSVTLKGGTLTSEKLFLQLIAKTTCNPGPLPHLNVAVGSERVIWNTVQDKTQKLNC